MTTDGFLDTKLTSAMADLRQQRASTGPYRNIRTDEAVGYVLDAAGFKGGRNLQKGSVTLEWWVCENEDPIDALVKLVAAEGPKATLYEDAAGVIVFETAR